MWVTRALLKASPGYFAVNYPCPEKLPVHRTIQGLTLSSYQPLSSSAQGCIVWGFFPLSTAPTPARLLSFKLPAVTEMSLGLKMATVNSSSNLPFPKCFLGAHWQTLFQGAEHRWTLFPDLSSGPFPFLPPPSPFPTSSCKWMSCGWSVTEEWGCASSQRLRHPSQAGSKQQVISIPCVPEPQRPGFPRSKVQPRSSEGSPALYWPECGQSTLGLRCFLSTSSWPAKIRLSSSSCPSLLSFPFIPDWGSSLWRGVVHKYLIFSNLPSCSVCQLQTAVCFSR